MPRAKQGRGSHPWLNKGGSPGRPKEGPDDKEIRKTCKALLKRPAYVKMLQSKLDAGTLHPSINCLLYYYAHGKPAEDIEIKQVIPVRVVHDYS
jgi:hypothetical protein